ncbi:MAG: hypothetical protein RIS64_1603 [Bacteroidota bacterium]|jgi:hypothetical protein
MKKNTRASIAEDTLKIIDDSIAASKSKFLSCANGSKEGFLGNRPVLDKPKVVWASLIWLDFRAFSRIL